MKSGIIRWTIYFVAVLGIGPVAGALVALLHAADGGRDATPIVSTAPVLGVLLAFAAGLLAVVPGALQSRLVDAKAGLIAAGLVLAWPAYRGGSVTGLFRADPSGGVLVRLAVEGVILGTLAVVVSALVEAAERGRDGSSPRPRLREVLPALAAGVVAGAAAAWAIGQTPLTGQAFAAACAGGVAAGAAAHLVDPRIPLTLAVAAVSILGVLAPLSGTFSGDPSAAARMNTLFPLATITPLHWAAGGLIGVPMGVAWAASMMEKKREPAAA